MRLIQCLTWSELCVQVLGILILKNHKPKNQSSWRKDNLMFCCFFFNKEEGKENHVKKMLEKIPALTMFPEIECYNVKTYEYSVSNMQVHIVDT